MVRGRPPVGMFVVALATALGACAPQPVPVVVLTPAPATQSFGNVYVGTSRMSASITWTNTGRAPVEILGVLTTPMPPFAAVRQPATPPTLAPGESTPSYAFVFAPQTPGPASGGATPQSLQIVLPDIAQEVAFTGTGIVQFNTGSVAIAGGHLVAGQVLDFGPVAVPGGAPVLRSFTLRNHGTQVAYFDAAFTMGGQGFQLVSPALFIMVPAGGSRDIVLQFVPPAVGRFTDGVTFVDVVGWNNETGTAISGEGVPGG